MWGSSNKSSTSNNIGSKNNRVIKKKNLINAKGIYRLLAFIGFCWLLYKVWGPLLLVTCSLAVILHLCYSLCISDSVFTPYSLVLLKRAKILILELTQTTRALFEEGLDKSRLILDYLKRLYEKRFSKQHEISKQDAIMSENKKNLYRPSVLVNKNVVNINPKNNELYQTFALNGINSIGKTSTPLSRGSNSKSNHAQNGINMFSLNSDDWTKKSTGVRSENKPTFNLSQHDDSQYSSKNSSLSRSTSPKIRDKSENSRIVQTVAGPLLNSSRYNINPKLYTDVSSPGLSSRLTKYANEANKLIYQPQYGMGQFPKVNLSADSIPVLSPKVIRSRTPVTVRVAPPDITNYTINDGSNQQDKSKMYSSNDDRESKLSPMIVDSFKKTALKRHASREDAMSLLDLAKKLKADQGQLENLEEMMQKRARDESTTSDEDLTPQSRNHRPTKRSKSSSCHDVLNSLSSSSHIFTGVKRKAMDSFRDDSRENEKHFKMSNTSMSPNKSTSLTLLPSQDVAKSKQQLNVRFSIEEASGEPHQNKFKNKDDEIVKPDDRSIEKKQESLNNSSNSSKPKILSIKIITPPNTEKLTDKLFMKPVPPPNEKLKSLFEEQGKVEAQFKTDGKDEIKKQDIDDMRQNSMRLRLKSMFDAISGNSANEINPNVVIQAEEVNPPTATTTASSFATLNSLTTTTTINTSPITTTIVPILKSADDIKSTSAPKHVTFNLPSSSSSSSSSGLSTFSSHETLAESNATTFNLNNKPIVPVTVTNSSLATSNNNFSNVESSKTTITTTVYSPSTGISSTVEQQKNTTSEKITTSNDTTKPAAYKFGFATTATTTSSVPMLSFTPTSTPSFSATSPTSSAPSFSFNTSSSTAPTFSFSSNTSLTTAKTTESTSTTPALNFGNSLSKSPASTSFVSTNAPPTINFNNPISSSTFSVNNNTTSTIVTNSAPPAFPFGANNKTSTSGFSFNAPALSSKPIDSAPVSTTATFNYGSNNSATTGAPNSSTIFKGPMVTTTTSSGFCPTTVNFGTSSAVSVAKTTTSNIFGNTATSTSTVSNLFGNTGSTTLSPFAGASTQQQQQQLQPQQNRIFTGTNVVTTTASIFNTSTATGSIFNGANSAATSLTSTSSSTDNTKIFGGSKPFGTTTAPTFGANNQTSGFNVPSLNNNTNTLSPFAAQNPAKSTPTFGIASSTTSGPIFGATTNTFVTNTGVAPSNFGSANPTNQSAFGTTSQTNAFGLKPQSNIFGSNTTTVGNTFGAGTTGTNPNSSFNTGTSTFGTGTFNAPANNSPFGQSGVTQQSATQVPTMFGNTPPTSTSTSGSGFSFGGGGQSIQQPNSSFNFGSSNSTGGTPNGGGMFQFGGANNNAAKPTGFNFNAPSGSPSINFSGSAPPPAFNAPAQNMFSIGSGSSTPRSRTSRQRRQR